MLRRVAQLATVGGTVAFVVALTLFDPPEWLGLVPPPLLDRVGFRPLEMTANVVLFVPFGLSLGGWWPSRPRVLVAAFVLSVGIELAQLTMPDRVSDPVDVLMNVTGAVIGFFVMARLRTARAGRGGHDGVESG